MRHAVTTRRVLYEIPGMHTVQVRAEEFPGADGQPLPLAIYQAVHPISDPPPVVVLVAGYPDAGFNLKLGCRFMEMEWTISMAQLIAASGMTAVTHSNRAPKGDAMALMQHLAGQRRGIWATSGHGPVALAALADAECAVLSNPIVDDGGQAPGASRPYDHKKHVFVIRSGKDETSGLNAALDRFVATALAANAPITLVNLPDAPHAFDLFHSAPETGQVLQQGLEFLKAKLR